MNEDAINSNLEDEIEYNDETSSFEITFPSDVDRAVELIGRSPVFREWIEREIRAHREDVGEDPRESLTRLERLGFLYEQSRHAPYTVSVSAGELAVR